MKRRVVAGTLFLSFMIGGVAVAAQPSFACTTSTTIVGGSSNCPTPPTRVCVKHRWTWHGRVCTQYRWQ